MAAPLYNLIIVHERRRIGKAPFVVDRHFENIIKGAAIWCYVYQFTALFTGILLIPWAVCPERPDREPDPSGEAPAIAHVDCPAFGGSFPDPACN